MKQRWIILDRDGVINQDSDNFVKSVDEFIFIPGSVEAIAKLCQAGFKVAIATNQSGIARGYYTVDTLHAMHKKLANALAKHSTEISAIAFCPHGPNDACSCRKPLPGMYQTLAAENGFALNDVPVIGDSLRDLQAAQQVNAQPILVRTGKGQRTLAKGEGLEGIPVYDNLAAAVDGLLANRK